ncbi:TLC domain-containing protein [Aureococcus anophagefferens]|nr:TLC domain-containing protein [Aureococcus anophagefferens]
MSLFRRGSSAARDDSEDDDDDDALPRQRSRSAVEVPAGGCKLRFVPDRWPPTISYHEPSSDDDDDDDGDGAWSALDPKPSFVGREVESLSITHDDGTTYDISRGDMRGMTGEQLALVLAADDHAATRRLVVAEAEVHRPSRAMRRVSERRPSSSRR